jgi:hypothetical protein
MVTVAPAMGAVAPAVMTVYSEPWMNFKKKLAQPLGF